MDFFKIHGLRLILRGYQKNKEQTLINFIHVQKGLVGELPNITERLE